MWKIECPNCHSLFRVVTEENKKLIADEKAEDIKENKRERVEEILDDLIPTGPPMGQGGRAPGSFGKEVPVDDLTYEYKFKCKKCGYEWTELKEEEHVDKS